MNVHVDEARKKVFARAVDNEKAFRFQIGTSADGADDSVFYQNGLIP
jgi:hypothetical protein